MKFFESWTGVIREIPRVSNHLRKVVGVLENTPSRKMGGKERTTKI